MSDFYCPLPASLRSRFTPSVQVSTEAVLTLILVNAQHMKAVPGHKTDVKDSEWLAELLRHGLLKPSFIPPEPIRILRNLTR